MDENVKWNRIIVCDGPVDIKEYGLCIGVIFNKVIKDIYVRCLRAGGYEVEFNVAWDVCNEYFNALVESFGYEQAVCKVEEIVGENMKIFHRLSISCEDDYSTVWDKSYDDYVIRWLMENEDDISVVYGQDSRKYLHYHSQHTNDNDIRISDYRMNVKEREIHYCSKCGRVYISRKDLCECGDFLCSQNVNLNALFESCCLVAKQMSEGDSTLNLVIEGLRETNLISPIIKKLECNLRLEFKAHGNMVDSQGQALDIHKGNKIDVQKMMDDYSADEIRLWCVLQSDKEGVCATKDAFEAARKEYRFIRKVAKSLVEKYGYLNEKEICEETGMCLDNEYGLAKMYSLIKSMAEQAQQTNVDRKKIHFIFTGIGIIMPNILHD